jgi:uncharacterized protein involved in outer membrane biogenesis
LQTTLLGLGIAVILALLAALAGPLLVDWGAHRSLFEAEASRLIGADVRVTGVIDARLLPSPRLTLHEIEIGKAGGENIRARSLGIEFALGPLMRGDWRATELHLAGPQIRLGLDASGHVQAPKFAVGFDPDALTIDRLSIEDGKVILADAANGAGVTLDRLSFNGEARSLIGPLKGEGAATIGGELYPFRISAGRYTEEIGLKLHINVDPVNRPGIETDGVLTLAGGAPRFEGALSLARPVGIAAPSANSASRTLTQSWRISGKVKASAQSALMENLEFQYGSEAQGLKLTGVANFKFGKNPRFDSVLSGRQIDLDRVLASGDGSRPLPAAAIRELAQLGGAVFRPTIPIQIGVGIDQITLGGASIQNLRGDISTDSRGWNLDRFEFRAPGSTQARLSGQLAVGAGDVVFTGPADIQTGDPKVLATWLEGRMETAQGELRPTHLRGDLTIGNERVDVERLKAEFDGKTISGRLAYYFTTPDRKARLDAELNAPDLDVDAALGFGNSLLAGSNIERPHDMNIAADVVRATIAGITARNASARLKIDSEGLQIDRLSVANLGGAAFSASGGIVTAAPSPHGNFRVDLDALDMTPVMALLARFAPGSAQALRRTAPAIVLGMAPVKLHARLSIESAAATTLAKLAIDGSLGKLRLALNGQANADPIALSLGDIKLDGKLEAEDGKALVAVLGLDRTVGVDSGPGTLSVRASGPLRGELKLDGKLAAGGLDANVSGTARLFGETQSAALQASIVRANLSPLRGPDRGNPALPVAVAAKIALAGGDLSFADITGNIGGANLRGKLNATLTVPYRLQGEIEADSIDGPGLIAAAIGMPAAAGQSQMPAAAGNNKSATLAGNNNPAWTWSGEPFEGGAFGDFTGQIALKATRFDMLARLTAQEFSATLHLGKDQFALDDMTGEVAGGRFAGQLSFRAAPDGLKAHTKFTLTGVDAAALMPAATRPPVDGSLGLSAEVEGSGLSPLALIGSLQGTGKLALTDAYFTGLDPRVFKTATGAVDQGLAIDGTRISDLVSKALNSGPLAVKHADGTIAVSAGQVRLRNVTVDSKDAALSLAGNLDLTDGFIDARLVLSGPNQASAANPNNSPDIFMALTGPAAAPSTHIDVSALIGWLTLRAVENQSKRLRAIEGASQELRGQAIAPNGGAAPSMLAPVLPAPVDIRPAPKVGRERAPAASVRP